MAWHVVVLWWLLWFWLGARSVVPLLFRENLYTASVVNSLSAVIFGSFFTLLALLRPSLLRCRIGFWAAAYYAVVVLATFTSPFLTGENLLRVLGLLATSSAITLALIIAFNLVAPLPALLLAAQGYVPGVLLTTLTLVVTNPSVLALQEAGGRFGDVEVLHPNSLGMAYGLGLLGLVFLPVYRSVLLRYGLAFLFAIALLATFSKTSIGAVVVAMGAAWFVLPAIRKLGFGLVAGLGGAFIALLVGDYVLDQWQAYLGNRYLLSTLTGRTVLWTLVLRLLAERPALGYGFAVMKDVVGPYASSIGWWSSYNQAHSAYLDALFSSGYLGMTFFALLVLRTLYLSVAAIRTLRGNLPAPYLAAITTFLLVRSVTEGALNLGFDFGVLMAVALASERVVRRGQLRMVLR